MKVEGRALGPARTNFNDYVGTAAADDRSRLADRAFMSLHRSIAIATRLVHRAGGLPKSWYDAGDQLLGQTHPHVDIERLGDQGLHVARDADAGG